MKQWIETYKRIVIIILMITVFLVGVLFWIFGSKTEKESETELVLKETEEKPKSNSMIKVDIKGAITSPGVYELEEDSRVEDAIQKSGGLLETADTSMINLSKQLEDEMVVVIYTKEEIQSLRESEQRENKVDQTCICPKIENKACVEEKVTNYDKPESEEKTNAKVSLNSGTLADFETLPGIGPSKAQAIVTYREEHGPFATIEGIQEVSGIGASTFAKIKDRLTL